MAAKRIVRRALAVADVEFIVDHDRDAAGPQVAIGFVKSYEAALQHVGLHPATGSPRYAQALGIPGLRSWQLTRYPYLVFYFERETEVEIWRVLHSAVHVQRWLQ